MITRKAAVGFILLALIVFPTAYLSWVPPMPKFQTGAVYLGDVPTPDTAITKKAIYVVPKLSTETPVEFAGIVTVIIELFALVCYLVLKRVEPCVVAFEKSERERIAKGNH